MRYGIVLAGLAIAATAHAGGIVIESYTQGRPANAGGLMDPMINVMAKSGFDAGQNVGRKYESEVSRPAIVKQGLPLDYDKQLAAAIAIAGSGKYHDAVVALAPLIEIAHANPGAFISHAASLPAVRKASVLLAVSQAGDGDKAAAMTTLAEVMRSFPDERVSASYYGQGPNQLFQAAQGAVTGRGKLIVTSQNANGVIYIDETLQAVQTVTRANIVPGVYRVFVQTGPSVSRVHEVNVVANQDTALTIDGDNDVFVETADYVGLKFPSDDVREKAEPEAAASFGNALNADQIVVIGIEKIQKVDSVTASLISKTGGKRIRKASVPLPSATPDQMKALALYVTGQGAAGGGIRVFEPEVLNVANPKGPDDPKGHDDDRRPIDGGERPRWGGYAWLSGGAAVAAVGVGLYLLHIDGRCIDSACINKTQSAIGGWATLGGGAVLAGISVYLFATAHADRSHVAYIVPTSGGAMAGYSLRF